MFLNGHLLGGGFIFNQYGFRSVSDDVPSHFLPGRNELLFVVNNNRGGPTGISYEAAVTLGDGNLAPNIRSSPPVKAHAEYPYEYPVKARDPNGDVLRFDLADGPEDMRIGEASGRISWTPGQGDIGPHAVTVTVTDSYGEAATQLFSLQVESGDGNTAPDLLNRPGHAGEVGIPYWFDASAFDADGDPLTFTDTSIESSAGPRIVFARDPQGGIISATDPAGNQVLYEYDAAGDLVAVTDVEGNLTQFIYNEPSRAHFLTEVIDPLGRTGVRTEYDDQGRLITLIDADGNPVGLAHDPDNFIETVTDALGNTTTFEYDLRGNVVTEMDALGGIVRRTYDGNNNVISETEPETGLATTFTYDVWSNLLTQTDPLGAVTQNTYNTVVPGAFAQVRGARPTSWLATTTDSLGNTTSYTHDAAGNVLTTTDAAGNTTSFIYDGQGNQTSITDAAGNITQFEYDASGRMTGQVDAAGNQTGYTYAANGNQLTETTVVTTPTGPRTLVTSTTYSGGGRPLSTTNAEGHTTYTEYDALGNQSATVDALGHRTEFQYDDRGQLQGMTFADGASTAMAYDVLGRRTSSTDRAGRATSYEYDALGRLTATVYPDDTPADDTDRVRRRRSSYRPDRRAGRPHGVHLRRGRQPPHPRRFPGRLDRLRLRRQRPPPAGNPSRRRNPLHVRRGRQYALENQPHRQRALQMRF